VGKISIQRTQEWRKQRHEILDEYLELFTANAHRTLDAVIDSKVIDDNWIVAGESVQVLPQTVMHIVCTKCTYKPKTKQREWASELGVLKKVIK